MNETNVEREKEMREFMVLRNDVEKDEPERNTERWRQAGLWLPASLRIPGSYLLFIRWLTYYASCPFNLISSKFA